MIDGSFAALHHTPPLSPWLTCPGYPRYTADVHAQFQAIIRSMNTDIGVTVATSNALFHQVQCGDWEYAEFQYYGVSCLCRLISR